MTVKTVATAAKAVASKTIDAVKPEVPAAQRQWAHLDSIANAKRGSDIMARRAEITAMESSMNATPINPGGHQSAAYMRSQIAQQIAEKREALKVVEALKGDDLVMRYCGEIIAQQYAPAVPAVTVNGAPLARGAMAPGFAPGMQNG